MVEWGGQHWSGALQVGKHDRFKNPGRKLKLQGRRRVLNRLGNRESSATTGQSQGFCTLVASHKTIKQERRCNNTCKLYTLGAISIYVIINQIQTTMEMYQRSKNVSRKGLRNGLFLLLVYSLLNQMGIASIDIMNIQNANAKIKDIQPEPKSSEYLLNNLTSFLLSNFIFQPLPFRSLKSCHRSSEIIRFWCSIG